MTCRNGTERYMGNNMKEQIIIELTQLFKRHKKDFDFIGRRFDGDNILYVFENKETGIYFEIFEPDDISNI